MSIRYFKAETIRYPDRLREGDVWLNKGLRFEGGRWVAYRKRSNALDRDWTSTEDAKLKAYFAAVYAGEDRRTLKEFAAELGRSPSACGTRAGKKLNILQQRDVKGGFCTSPTWSDEEHALLDEWYPKVPIGEVMAHLPGRSKSAVFARANGRGLVSPYAQQYRGWTPNEQRALRIAYKRGIAIADLAFAVGRNPLTASKYAKNHGFDFGRRSLLAESPSLALILSLEDETVPLPQLLSAAAMRPNRIAKRRAVETDDKELRRRERETMAARRKKRRLERKERRAAAVRHAQLERRRQRDEELAREKAARAQEREAALQERRRQREEEREIAKAERAMLAAERARLAEEQRLQRCQDRFPIQGERRRTNASMRRNRAAAEAFIDAGGVVTKATPIHIKITQRAIIDLRAQEARRADPLEQAKIRLQRRGKVVHSMAVWGGSADRFFVSGLGKDVTAEQLLAEADRMAA